MSFFRQWKPWMKIGMILLLFVLVAGIGFRVTMLKSVKIKGNILYTEEEIKNSVIPGIWEKNAFILYVKDKLGGIDEPPFVQEIDLEWTSRRNVIIHVYEKSIIGCMKYMNQYVYFDRDGIVLQSTEKPLVSVPYVTGVDFGDFVLHEKISVEDDGVFEVIMNLSQIISHLNLDIDRIHISGSEVTLVSGKVKILLGDEKNYDEALTALKSVLKTVKKENYEGEIDLTGYKSGSTIPFRSTKEKKKKKKAAGIATEAGITLDDGAEADVPET